MNNFTFYSPTLFAFGDGEERKTGELVRRFGGTRVLLVIGGGSVRRNGAYDAVTASLKDADLPWAELSGVEANPRTDKVEEGIEILRREGCDFLLALGGGSVIDTAKVIGFAAGYDGDVWDYFLKKVPITGTIPVGVVLTIAAAGSEGSDSAVITHKEGNWKWGCPKTDLIRPKFAVMNPRFTCSLPPYQTASGAADIIAHILERYFTHTQDVALTDRLCEGLMKTVMEAARRALEDPNNYAARADLMWGGMLGQNDLCGTGRTQDWGSHQIEHELSSFYGCAHGAGLAVVLPAWMQYVMKQDIPRFARFAVEVMGCEMDASDPERTAKEGICRLRQFFREIGMPTTLQEVGGRVEDIPAMVAHRAERPGGFPFGNFVKVGPSEMEAILEITAAN